MTIIFWQLIKSKAHWFSSIVVDMVGCSIFQSLESIPGEGEANAANFDLNFGVHFQDCNSALNLASRASIRNLIIIK
jgi:hypothetical protein